MLDWLRRQLHAAAGILPDDVRKWVYALVHAVAAISNTIFGHVGKEWNELVHAASQAKIALYRLGQGIGHFYNLAVHHWLPNLKKYLLHLLSEVKDYAVGVYKYAVRELKHLRDLAWKWIQDLTKWVNDHIWKPLYSWVQDLYKKMTDWAYTAWWYITHPDKLAERLFWFLADLVKKEAWSLASIFGEFGAKTFLANIPRVIALIEKIMTDVL